MSAKRFLTISFLLFALAGNAAWGAMNYHATQDDTAASPDYGYGHNLPNTAYDDGCDDHCCHAGAHFLGLLGSPSIWTILPSSDSYLTSDKQPVSRPLSPLFQPPIA